MRASMIMKMLDLAAVQAWRPVGDGEETGGGAETVSQRAAVGATSEAASAMCAPEGALLPLVDDGLGDGGAPPSPPAAASSAAEQSSLQPDQEDMLASLLDGFEDQFFDQDEDEEGETAGAAGGAAAADDAEAGGLSPMLQQAPPSPSFL